MSLKHDPLAAERELAAKIAAVSSKTQPEISPEDLEKLIAVFAFGSPNSWTWFTDIMSAVHDHRPASAATRDCAMDLDTNPHVTLRHQGRYLITRLVAAIRRDRTIWSNLQREVEIRRRAFHADAT